MKLSSDFTEASPDYDKVDDPSDEKSYKFSSENSSTEKEEHQINYKKKYEAARINNQRLKRKLREMMEAKDFEINELKNTVKTVAEFTLKKLKLTETKPLK